MNTRAHKVIMGMMIFALVGILWIIWATLMDGIYVRIPMVIYEQPNGEQMVTDKQEYFRGEMVKGLVKYCKNRKIEASLQWTIIDSYQKSFEKKVSNVLPGCHETLVEIEQIPLDQIKGPAYFETMLTYKINGFNTVEVPLRTNIFHVK